MFLCHASCWRILKVWTRSRPNGIDITGHLWISQSLVWNCNTESQCISMAGKAPQDRRRTLGEASRQGGRPHPKMSLCVSLGMKHLMHVRQWALPRSKPIQSSLLALHRGSFPMAHNEEDRTSTIQSPFSSQYSLKIEIPFNLGII